LKPIDPRREDALTAEFTELLNRSRSRVDRLFNELVSPQPGIPSYLLEAMRYSLLAGGKRLRPLLVILAAEAAGGQETAALPAGCAVEMVHTYSLIHDDLPAMDDDDLRRGQPTCHKKFGEALAILAGDALLTLAFGVLAERYPPRTAAACCHELATGAGAAGMVGGQVDDLAWERGGGTLADLEHLHARKTGALFRACLRIGATVALGESGVDAAVMKMMDEFGRCFGLAFQITDDLLDIEGQEDQTGKRVQKDAARGKLTYPGFLGVAESRRRVATLVREAEDCLVPLGPRGQRLAELARSIAVRDR
jgi:geranylgeranyl diphosphate synthase type II